MAAPAAFKADGASLAPQTGLDSGSSSVSPTPPTRSWIASLVVVFGVSFAVIALSSSGGAQFLRATTSGSLSLESKNGRKAGQAFWTLVRKGYEPMDYFVNKGSTKLTYKKLGDYYAVVEPGAEMELYVEDYDSESIYRYEWSLCNSNYSTCKKGKMCVEDGEVTMERVRFDCSPSEELHIKATKHDTTTDEQVSTFEGTVLCSYVRRELRSLTSQDLSAAMDAMAVVYTTDEEEGQKLYGDKSRH